MNATFLKNPLVLLFFLLLPFLVGYAWGRRAGLSEGYNTGAKYAPLDLRRRMWLHGRCPLCQKDGEEQEHLLSQS